MGREKGEQAGQWSEEQQLMKRSGIGTPGSATYCTRVPRALDLNSGNGFASTMLHGKLRPHASVCAHARGKKTGDGVKTHKTNGGAGGWRGRCGRCENRRGSRSWDRATAAGCTGGGRQIQARQGSGKAHAICEVNFRYIMHQRDSDGGRNVRSVCGV
eukprot:349677-Chlamydomonas_euryale.AAC.3